MEKHYRCDVLERTRFILLRRNYNGVLETTGFNKTFWRKVYLWMSNENLKTSVHYSKATETLGAIRKEVSKEEAIGLNQIVQETKPLNLDNRMKRFDDKEVIELLQEREIDN